MGDAGVEMTRMSKHEPEIVSCRENLSNGSLKDHVSSTETQVTEEAPTDPGNVKEPDSVFNQIELELSHFETGYENLENERNSLKDQLEEMRRENALLEEKLASKQEAHQQALAQMVTLRNIILNKAGTQKTSDTEIRDLFVSVRQKTQALCNNRALQLDHRPYFTPEAPNVIVDFYSSWIEKTAIERRRSVMAQVFSILYDRILSLPCFGLEGVDVDGRNDLELGLCRFERFLKRNHVNRNTIIDWRIATIDCVDLLKPNDQVGKKAAYEIDEFLSPILPKGTSTQELDMIWASILDLCETASATRMMMRKSKEYYKCLITLKDAESYSYDDWVEPMGVVDGKNQEPGEDIAYTLFGGLAKCPINGNDKKVVILEKAHVVLKRKRSSVR